METFVQALSGYIGSTVEVMVTNQVFEGSLTAVTPSTMQVTESTPVEYVPSGTPVTIPLPQVEFVRIIVS